MADKAMANRQGHSDFDESIRESLSALLDGEATELETRRVLTNLDEGSALRATWSRYQSVSRVMRSEQESVPKVDLSLSIAAAIAGEPEHHALDSKQTKPPSRWLGAASLLGKGAIAASVALVALFGVNQYTAQQQLSSGGELATVDTATQTDLNTAVNLPMGYGTPGLSVRNVSTGSASAQAPRQYAVPVQFVPRTETPLANPAVQEFLQQLMAEHANAGAEAGTAIPFERVPRIAIEPE